MRSATSARTWLPPALSMNTHGMASPGKRARTKSRSSGIEQSFNASAPAGGVAALEAGHGPDQRQEDDQVDQGGADQGRRVGRQGLRLGRLLEQVGQGHHR